MNVVPWVENSVVSMSSNHHGTEPVIVVKYFFQYQSIYIQVQLAIVTEYNKHISGVNWKDEEVAKYCLGIHSKKLWWPIFT